jgi:UDP-3-O-[3-hydroxymyristoyl] glucosamine N-acyltransferase
VKRYSLAHSAFLGNGAFLSGGPVGFGYSRNEKGELEKFPHLGGVVIEDDVDIGSNTSIDRGTLGNTLIRQGAKIDNLVHIAHNVVVGKHAAVIAHAMIGGSTVIGDYGWVAPSAALMNGIAIGTYATVGLGAVVTKDIPADETWAGIPARPLKEFSAIQRALKGLINK